VREGARVPPTVYAATKNSGKFAELRDIFAAHGWTVESFAQYGDVAEGERSYAENAALKARGLARDLARASISAAVVGDDSGLEVCALSGRPGILSARYGGDSTWMRRRRMLLDEVDAAAPAGRDARFVCALHFIDVDGMEVAVAADLGGTIARDERGDGGFSYDAIFCERGSTRTFAEISRIEKNLRSHRAIAIARLVEAVRARGANFSHDGT